MTISLMEVTHLLWTLSLVHNAACNTASRASGNGQARRQIWYRVQMPGAQVRSRRPADGHFLVNLPPIIDHDFAVAEHSGCDGVICRRWLSQGTQQPRQTI
jgi:hypothetical protein